ncbi:MAG: hypothetical protein JWR19_3641 [Pedosphaera sp.]|nr:hypothetical protein [Pedosphaera sp.]
MKRHLRQNLFWKCALLLAIYLGPYTCRAQTNLILNGGFESGFAGWVGTYGILKPQNYAINPGPLDGVTVGVVDASQQPMRQTIATIVGLTYEINFGMRLPDLDSSGVPIAGDSIVGPALLTLAINNQPLSQTLVQNRTGWLNYSFDFTANSASSELEFSIPQYLLLNGQLQRSESAFIDSVTVIEVVPEPTAMMLVLVAGSMLAIIQVNSRYCHANDLSEKNQTAASGWWRKRWPDVDVTTQPP